MIVRAIVQKIPHAMSLTVEEDDAVDNILEMPKSPQADFVNEQDVSIVFLINLAKDNTVYMQYILLSLVYFPDPMTHETIGICCMEKFGSS